ALDEAAPGDELDARRGQQRVPLVRQRARLEAEAAGEELGELSVDVAAGLDELDAVELARAGGVAEVGVEAGASGVDDERGVRAREPRQVADVDQVRDEQRLL